MTLGKRIIASLEDFIAHVRAGKPVRQSIVRRMKVKGETVYAHETFEAPPPRPPRKKGGGKQ